MANEIYVGSPAIEGDADELPWIVDDPVEQHYTYIDYNNPANAGGIIHTVEIYMSHVESEVTLQVGSFVDNGGGSFTCHDSVMVSGLSHGFNRITGLSIAINAGEYIGAAGITGNGYGGQVSHSNGSGAGVYYVEGVYADPEDTTTYSLYAYPGGILHMCGIGNDGSGTALVTVWTGSAWVTPVSIKYWTGAAWQNVTSIKRWSGAEWVTVWE